MRAWSGRRRIGGRQGSEHRRRPRGYLVLCLEDLLVHLDVVVMLEGEEATEQDIYQDRGGALDIGVWEHEADDGRLDAGAGGRMNFA
jgi:hypothetical protein